MISYLNKSKLKIKEKLYGEFFRDDPNSGVNFKEYEEDLFKEITLPSRLEQCNVSDFESIRRFIEYKTKKIFFLKEILEEDFLFYDEYIKSEKISLEGKFGEIKSKIAFLGGFEGNVISSLVENFYNFNQIDTNKERSLKIEDKAGVCTLEVSKQTAINFQEIKILSSSNGVAGNILEGTNSYPTNSLNKNDNLYFEFYKKGSNSLKLNIELLLSKEEVINFIELSTKKKYLESNFIIKDMLFIKDDGTSTNLFSLIDSNFQDLEIESYNAENKLSIACLPVKARRIKIFLVCNEPSIIDNASYNVIALKEIAFYKRVYAESGKISFKNLILNSSPGSILKKEIVSYPKREDLFIFESKAIFEEEDEIILNDNKIIVENDYDDVSYEFKMSKPENLNGLYSDNESYEEINLNVKQQRFNRDIIPNIIEMPYNSANIEVYQPELYDRSFQVRKSKKIGRTKYRINKFTLPSSLIDLGISRMKLQVYANSELCTLKYDNNLTEDLDCFSDGEFLWLLDTSETKQKEIKVNICPSETFTWKENDKVYFETKQFLDKDLNRNKIISFKKDFQAENEIFFEGLERIKLKKDFVCNVKVKNESEEDITNKYSINNKTGLLVLSGEKDFSQAEVEYDWFDYKTSSPDSFITVNEEVVGFCIEENKLHLNSFQQTRNELFSDFKIYRDLLLAENQEDISISNSKLINKFMILKSRNILKGSLVVSPNFFGEDKKPLEVDYIDGESEFLNLEYIEKEAAPLIEANSLGEFKFTLRNKPSSNRTSIRVYRDNKILEDASYEIDGRIITITSSYSDSRKFSVSYFTENVKASEEAFVKYSVDYLNGILFSESTLEEMSNEKVFFESSCSVLENKVCKKINSWTLKDSNIHLNGSETSTNNSLIKVSWKEREVDSFEGLREFYSPIVYQLKYELRG